MNDSAMRMGSGRVQLHINGLNYGCILTMVKSIFSLQASASLRGSKETCFIHSKVKDIG